MNRRPNYERSGIEKLARIFQLFMQQQYERAYYGGRMEYYETEKEGEAIAEEIIPVFERYLDEDLVRKFRDGDLFERPTHSPLSMYNNAYRMMNDMSMNYMRMFTGMYPAGYQSYEPYRYSRPRHIEERSPKTRELILDFYDEVEQLRRKARTDKGAVDAKDISELTNDLKDKLSDELAPKQNGE